jgi:hypothetical protein
LSTITADDIKDAAGLWGDYFRLHAQAAIYRAGRSREDRLARKVAHWLITIGLDEVPERLSGETLSARRSMLLGQMLSSPGWSRRTCFARCRRRLGLGALPSAGS